MTSIRTRALSRALLVAFSAALVPGCGDSMSESTTGNFTGPPTTDPKPTTATNSSMSSTSDPSETETETETTEGATAGPVCDPPELECGGECVDVEADPDHCGACDNVCGDDQVCDGGVCALGCEEPLVACGDTCVDTQSDDAHCGGCGSACAEDQACEAGVCEDICDDALLYCGGDCADINFDNNHCGGCDNACDTDQGFFCVEGGCKTECSQSELYCDQNCVDPQVDSDHCGACGNGCDINGGELCIAGECVLTKCGNGFVDEDDGEHCDIELPDPYDNVGCRDSVCQFDFSEVTQLYCSGSCSWDPVEGCQQADADIFCKLRTGNANSVAAAYMTATAMNEGGFACSFFPNINLGPLPEFGINTDVIYQESSILVNHGPGTVIINPVCTDPP